MLKGWAPLVARFLELLINLILTVLVAMQAWLAPSILKASTQSYT